MPKVLDPTGRSPIAPTLQLHQSGRWLLLSLWLTLLMLAVQVIAGVAMGSLSLIAAALHTLICSFSLLLAAIATSKSQGLPRQLLGHGRLESGLALLLVGFLSFVGLNLLVMGLHELDASAHHTPQALALHLHAAPMLLLVGMLVINLGLACLEQAQGKRLDSPSLRAIATYRWQDSGFNFLVLVGITLAAQGPHWLDPLLAVAGLSLVLSNCLRVLNRQLPLLLKQVAIAPEALAQTIHQVEGVLRCVSIHSQGLVGRSLVVEVQVVLHPEFLGIAPDLMDRVEAVIRERYGPVKVLVHLHPRDCASAPPDAPTERPS